MYVIIEYAVDINDPRREGKEPPLELSPAFSLAMSLTQELKDRHQKGQIEIVDIGRYTPHYLEGDHWIKIEDY